MPSMTVVEVLNQVRERWPDVIRISRSGYTAAEDIIAGVNEAGIWQYLLKPWQPEQLLLTLQRASEVWRLQQDNQRLSLELRTAAPALRQRVESKQEKLRSRFGLTSVSYTHLDVYKRQPAGRGTRPPGCARHRPAGSRR